ncbi:MAG: UDP-N-acetylmuramoylalanine--D-glutamate ligase [Syntrophomonadaceae bacterium]|nr:UDP-N-acetylmuramoylalanine--D-glutamate ligase [Bacillota bacterium]
MKEITSVCNGIGGNVVVIGLGRSGLAAARLLKKKGARVKVSEVSQGNNEIGERAKLLLDEGIEVETGRHSLSLIDEASLVVVSPGVPQQAAPISHARRRGVPVISELELAACFCRAPLIAIGGTNGKSTTVTLLVEIFKRAGKPALIAGNIGYPLCDFVDELTPFDLVVVEVSSFQLETIKSFRPWIAILLNITPDHLDRYNNSFDNYTQAELELFRNQSADDYALLNDDDPLVRMAPTKARVIKFSQRNELSEGTFVKDGWVYSRFDGKEKAILSCDEIKLHGVHNRENVLAAVTAAIIYGVDSKDIGNVLRRFSGLEHRVEFVREVAGVRFINDSKGTNVGAVLKSLESISSPIILIAGGRGKGADFSCLTELAAAKVKVAILLGEATDVMEKELMEAVQVKRVDSLNEAVRLAHSLANEGDTVLLSPGCSSLDMFANFEERGEAFKKMVRDL